MNTVPAPWCWFVYDADDMVIAQGVWHRGDSAEDVAEEQIARLLWRAQPDFWKLTGVVCRAWPTGRQDEWVESHAAEWLGLLMRSSATRRHGAA